MIFFRKNLLFVLALAFASGLPLALTTSTLRYWLTEAGISLGTVGMASLLGMPYILKPLWAPFLDQVKLPFLGKRLGLRRGWLLLVQIMLSLSIMFLGAQDPQSNLTMLFIAAIAVAFFSATQDDIIDAFRIEILKEEEQGIGATYAQLGYRIAMLFSSLVILTVAEVKGWQLAHFLVAITYFPLMVVTLFLQEPALKRLSHKGTSYLNWFITAFIQPFAEFSTRKNWFLILLFIILYKLGDAYLGAMTPSFINLMGYSKTEYAMAVKAYSFVAALLGMFVGGFLHHYVNLGRLLIISCMLQSLSNLLFFWPLYSGHNLVALGVTNFVETFVGIIGSTAFIAYASMLCNKKFTATQYALLSALASTGRVFTSASSGFLQQSLGWDNFFIFSALLTLPAILIIPYIIPRNHQN